MTAWSGTPDGGAAGQRLHPDQRARRRRLRQDDGRAAVRAELRGGAEKQQGRRPSRPSPARIVRTDGQQELKGVDITLPPGATAKLAGVPYCPPADDRRRRRTRRAPPSRANCELPRQKPGRGRLGRPPAPGPRRFASRARSILAGRYKGAPVSLVGGHAGGRRALRPRQRGRQGAAASSIRRRRRSTPSPTRSPTSSAAPSSDIRSVVVNVNRKDFTLNGTNCSKFATAGALRGGGADPTNPAAFSSFPVSDPVQLDQLQARSNSGRNCNLRLFGATKRAKHPQLRAILKARPGDANIARASVALPHALFLDQASLAKICTRVQFAADDCPKKSIYGAPARSRRCSANRSKGRSTCARRTTRCPTSSPTSRARSTSTWSAASTASAAASAPPSTASPTCRSPNSRWSCPAAKSGLLVASGTSAKAGQGDRPLQSPERQEAQQAPKLRTPCKGKRAGKAKRGGRRGRRRREIVAAPVQLSQLALDSPAPPANVFIGRSTRALRRGSVFAQRLRGGI